MCQAKNEIPQQSDEWKTEIFTKMNGKSNKKKNHTKEATEMKKRRKKPHRVRMKETYTTNFERQR